MGVHFQVNPPPLVFGDLYDFVELTADASGYGPCKLETWVWQLWQLQRKIVSEWQLPVSLRHMLLAKMTSLDSCYSRSQSTFKKGDVHSSSNKQIFKLQFRCHINFKHNQSIIKAYHKFRIWFISYHYLHHLLYKYLEIKLSKPMWIYLHEMSWSNMSRGIRLREKNQPPESPERKRELFWELLQEKERPNLLPWNSIFLRSTNVLHENCLKKTVEMLTSNT